MVLVVPAVCALGRGLLRAQHHPRLHMRARSAAIQRGAQAGAAGVAFPLRPPGCPVAGGLLKGQRRWPVRAPHCPVVHFGHIFANWVSTGFNYATWH